MGAGLCLVLPYVSTASLRPWVVRPVFTTTDLQRWAAGFNGLSSALGRSTDHMRSIVEVRSYVSTASLRPWVVRPTKRSRTAQSKRVSTASLRPWVVRRSGGVMNILTLLMFQRPLFGLGSFDVRLRHCGSPQFNVSTASLRPWVVRRPNTMNWQVIVRSFNGLSSALGRSTRRCSHGLGGLFAFQRPLFGLGSFD